MEYMKADTKVNGYMVYPRFLSTIDVGSTEKIVYVYLFNRARSSQRASKSGKFTDQLGRVYIVYPIKDLAADTGFTERWVKKSMKELEEAGLIERKREGKNKPDKIYVKVPGESSESENGGEQSFTSEGNDTSPVRGTIVHLLNIEEKKRKKLLKKAGDPPAGNANTPDFEDVSEYFLDAGCENRLASRFMNYYDGTGWMTKTGKPITNWKAFADMWIDREQEKQQIDGSDFPRL